MNVNRWELFLEGARFYEGENDELAESFYRKAQTYAMTETNKESAASAVVLDHFAEFLERKGRTAEAENCSAQARQIMCAYGGPEPPE